MRGQAGPGRQEAQEGREGVAPGLLPVPALLGLPPGPELLLERGPALLSGLCHQVVL